MVVKQTTTQKPKLLEECVTAEEAPGLREDYSAEKSNQQARISHLQEQPAAEAIIQKPEDAGRRSFKEQVHLEALKIFSLELHLSEQRLTVLKESEFRLAEQRLAVFQKFFKKY